MNKQDADWTYLIMKVRQMRANLDINRKDREKRTNERTKQKFMTELSTTRENEENPFFRHGNQLFRKFLENIGNCFQQYFM